ncbi:MAG: hypothetical protein RLZZ297_1325 [Chloroflexota bacterium]|jgi:thiol-disulfide isomerase/thioredoxin
MTERILVLTLIAAAVVFLRWYLQQPTRRAHATAVILPIDHHGKAGIVALTAPGCTQCERLQKPALLRISDKRDDINVSTADIGDHPDLVKRLGIMTVPTTIVHSADGTIHHVNLGYTDDVTLYNQLAIVSAPPHCV